MGFTLTPKLRLTYAGVATLSLCVWGLDNILCPLDG